MTWSLSGTSVVTRIAKRCPLHFDALSVHRVRGLRLVLSGPSVKAVLNGVEFPFPGAPGIAEA